MQYRKLITITKQEAKSWKILFSLFGYKADCIRKTGVCSATISRVIQKERGLEEVVEKIRKYYAENNDR